MDTTETRLAEALADRYRLERELGAGGMATVYLADDLSHHRKVALKVLRPDVASAIGAERFTREITTTGNLRQPNILPLLDSGERVGFLYYVTLLVGGESLRDRLDRDAQLPHRGRAADCRLREPDDVPHPERATVRGDRDGRGSGATLRAFALPAVK